MGIKTYNPYTPSRRNMSGYDFEDYSIYSGEIPDNFFEEACGT